MYRFRVLITLSASLAWLAVCVLIVASWLELVPDTHREQQATRARSAEMLATHVSTLLTQNNLVELRTFLAGFRQHNADIQSLGIRTATGILTETSGNHRALWDPSATENKTPEQLAVPLIAKGRPWGKVELRYVARQEQSLLWRLKDSPFGLLLYVFLVAGPIYFLYLKRILRQLDPSAVIPDRVQATLDTLAEGLLIIDDLEQIVFANTAFAHKTGKDPRQLLGLHIHELNWDMPANATEAGRFPWRAILRQGRAERGQPVSLRLTTGQKLLLNMNGAPVTDAGNRVRGATLTFDDVTELEAKNVELAQTVSALEKTRADIARQNEQLEVLATRDAMTGCFNRRAFYEKFDQAFVRANADGTPLACIMCDLDHFKSINDTYGHAVGDKVIQVFAEVLQNVTRAEDIVGRYGGEEFCIALPGLDLQGGAAIAEAARAAIENSGYRFTSGRKVTGSFGVTAFGLGAHSPAELSEEADKALYVAKANGRNRVVGWSEAVAAQAAELEALKKAEKIAVGRTVGNSAEVKQLHDRVQQLETLLSEQTRNLFEQAFIDTPTGLPNRRQLVERLGHELQHSKRNGTAVAVLLAASDVISKVNGIHGSEASDALIRDIANRLGQKFRASDSFIAFDSFDVSRNVYRFDNFELAIVLADLKIVDDTAWLVKRLFETLHEPFTVAGEQVFPGLNVGIGLYPVDGETPETLLAHAKLALDYARPRGPNAYQFFDQEINNQAIRQLQFETWMHQALDSNEFHLLFQPKTTLRNDRFEGFEALLRWAHPSAGNIPPKEFIHIAEKSGQIIKLGDWVLHAACRQLQIWRQAGLPTTSIAVNLSLLELRSRDFLARLDAVLEQYQIAPETLAFEVTETVFDENLIDASACLQTLRERRHSVHIDDFGTGYSSFAYIQQLPADALKIDQAFINNIAVDTRNQKIVGAIVSMAHDLGMRCIAEGVETAEQLQVLRQLGCDSVQGFLLSYPLSGSEAAEYLRITKAGTATGGGLLTWLRRETHRRKR